jgi:hypothetical protein
MGKKFVSIETEAKSSGRQGDGQNAGSGLQITGGKWGKSKAAEKLSKGQEGVKGHSGMGPVLKKERDNG